MSILKYVPNQIKSSKIVGGGFSGPIPAPKLKPKPIKPLEVNLNILNTGSAGVRNNRLLG